MEAKQQEVVTRLKRIEGQIRGIQRLVEEGQGCEAVVAQMLSARAALDGAVAYVVTTYIDECLTTKPTGETRQDIGRVIKLLSRTT